MNSLLFGIAISAILSSASVLIVLLRISPLTATVQAVPALYLSVFLTISSIMTLFFVLFWRYVPHHWDTAKLMTISLRQGIFTGCITISMLLFLRLELLTWWIALMITAVFVLVELALES